MEVQATAGAPPLAPIAFTSVPAAVPPSTGAGAVSSGASAWSGNAAVEPRPPANGASAEPALHGSPLPSSQSATLGDSIAQMFDLAADTVSVSFQVARDSNQVVVVFTDKASGKTIAQVPSETVIALAQFFKKLAGDLVDKKV